MKRFGWLVRLKYVAIAGLAGWAAGVTATIPVEIGVARRYIAGTSLSLTHVFAEGMLVWAVFALLMALAGWIPLVLPCALILPPRWVVRARWVLVPASCVFAAMMLGLRLRSFQDGIYRRPGWVRDTFLSSLNIFVVIFTLVTATVYVLLARRRLQPN